MQLAPKIIVELARRVADSISECGVLQEELESENWRTMLFTQIHAAAAARLEPQVCFRKACGGTFAYCRCMPVISTRI